MTSYYSGEIYPHYPLPKFDLHEDRNTVLFSISTDYSKFKSMYEMFLIVKLDREYDDDFKIGCYHTDGSIMESYDNDNFLIDKLDKETIKITMLNSVLYYVNLNGPQINFHFDLILKKNSNISRIEDIYMKLKLSMDDKSSINYFYKQQTYTTFHSKSLVARFPNLTNHLVKNLRINRDISDCEIRDNLGMKVDFKIYQDKDECGMYKIDFGHGDNPHIIDNYVILFNENIYDKIKFKLDYLNKIEYKKGKYNFTGLTTNN